MPPERHAVHTPATQRDPRLDVFRGLAMAIILVAHVPGNPLAEFIPARFGPSDAAEMFVFCSGFAAALVEQPLLFPTMTVGENVGFGLRMRGEPPAQIARRVREMLELVRLPGLESRRPQQLSGGQEQRVALARGLIIGPQVLLLDEPLSALDAKVRVQLREQIRYIQQTEGTTTLLVTHDQEEALTMADRVGVMNLGKMEQLGTPEEVYLNPATAFVSAFVGVVNRIPAQVRRRK